MSTNRKPYPVLMEDASVHTDASPFCCDPTCPCHQDQALLDALYQAFQDGLVTAEQATRIANGMYCWLPATSEGNVNHE